MFSAKDSNPSVARTSSVTYLEVYRQKYIVTEYPDMRVKRSDDFGLHRKGRMASKTVTNCIISVPANFPEDSPFMSATPTIFKLTTLAQVLRNPSVCVCVPLPITFHLRKLHDNLIHGFSSLQSPSIYTTSIPTASLNTS
jgi:hypothetical protein